MLRSWVNSSYQPTFKPQQLLEVTQKWFRCAGEPLTALQASVRTCAVSVRSSSWKLFRGKMEHMQERPPSFEKSSLPF